MPPKETSQSPSGDLVAVTPDNDNDLAEGVTRGIYVGVSGDLNVDTGSGQTVLLKNVAAGMVHPIRVKRVRATSTDATDIVAVY